MGATRKLGTRVVLFIGIEEAQHKALRFIAYKEKRSLADVGREAIDKYIKEKAKTYPIPDYTVQAEAEQLSVTAEV